MTSGSIDWSTTAHSDLAAPVLAAAHAYQTSSTRDELARHFHTGAELLQHTPNLSLVSTNGAGYFTEREASGKTVGIVGIGNVGRRVAELCGGLFRMQVIAYDPYVNAEEMRRRGARKVELDDLLRRADFVSINCQLTDETRKMIGAREYGLMRPTAYFITTARGFIHDEAALAEALRAKTIAGAGLDVWDKEPPPADHPLLQFDNVIASAHTAGVTRAKPASIWARSPPNKCWPRSTPTGRAHGQSAGLAGLRQARFERAFGFAPAR